MAPPRRFSMPDIETTPIFTPDLPVYSSETPTICFRRPDWPEADPQAKADPQYDSVDTEYYHAAGIDMDFQPPAGPPPLPVQEAVSPSSPESPFWPAIKHHLLHPSPITPPPKPHCPLCSRTLAIPGLGTTSPEPEHPHDLERAMVLPCGHLFGAFCFTQLTSLIPSLTHHPRCLHTSCHTPPLIHPQCGHTLAPFILSHIFFPGGEGPIPAVPPTLPEGGYIPPACPPCRVQMAWWFLTQAEEVLFEPGVWGPTWGEMVDPVTGTDYRGVWDGRVMVGRALHEAFGRAVWAAQGLEGGRPGWGGIWPWVVFLKRFTCRG